MKRNRYTRRLLLILFILTATVGCDQSSKVAAGRLLPEGPVLRLWGDTVRLYHTQNTGAFMSLGANLGEETRLALLVGGVGLVLASLLAYLVLARHLPLLDTAALSLVTGGGLSNLLDRLLHEGAVIDFMNVGIGSLRTATFNVADVAIFGGVGLLLLHTLLVPQHRPPAGEDAQEGGPQGP